MVKLYHGTTTTNAESIRESGKLDGPCYFTQRQDVAEDYAGDGEVITVSVNEDILKIDLDLPGGKLISVEAANAHLDRDDWAIDDYLMAGYSVGCTQSIEI